MKRNIGVRVKFTHLWTDVVGWQQTTFKNSNFKEVQKIGHTEKDGHIFMGINGNAKHILKGTLIPYLK